MTPLARRSLALIAMLSLAPVAFARAADDPPAAGVALVTATPAIVEPATGSVLDKPSTDVIVRSAPGDKVQLMVNGVAVKDNQIAFSAVPATAAWSRRGLASRSIPAAT